MPGLVSLDTISRVRWCYAYRLFETCGDLPTRVPGRVIRVGTDIGGT